ncbi:hypothetical protein [Streptomyces sp. NRRL S-350]|uniref:hypothetical protein n=1 Tax=Streptomyces sp. NRRL S-350 TaxID=1463902 RepID=UPI0004BE8091|nr:hypothetical protein [Streptomyces sp. NRRL S-350]
MKDTTAFVLACGIAGASGVLWKLIITWGQVRITRVETDNIHARADLARADRPAPPVPGRYAPPQSGGDLESGPLSNVRITRPGD